MTENGFRNVGHFGTKLGRVPSYGERFANVGQKSKCWTAAVSIATATWKARRRLVCAGSGMAPRYCAVLALKATRCRRALVGLEMGRPPGSTGEPPRSQELCRRRLRVD